MELKICEYCGTEYKEDLGKCPLCGHGTAGVFTDSQGKKAKGGARVAKKAQKQKKPDRIPQWMWAVICVVLGVAVLIGLLYFLFSMGYLGSKENVVIQQPAVEAPVEQPAVEEPVVEEPEPPVEEIPVDLSCTALELSQTGIVLEEKDSTIFLTALTEPADTTDPIVFSSQDETIATVDQSGMITAVGRGQTEIIVSCGSFVETCTIVCDFEEEEVPEEPSEENPDGEEPSEETPEETETPAEEKPEEVPQPKLNTEDFTLFRPGEEATIKVENAPYGALIKFSSSDPTVATVTDRGVVKAVGDGTATITVMVDDVKLICMARCRMEATTENNGGSTEVTGPFKLSNPVGNATDVTLGQAGESFTLYLVDANGTKVSGVSWATSNSGVCSVDASGKVSGTGKGTATVTATYGGQSYSCIVRCNF